MKDEPVYNWEWRQASKVDIDEEIVLVFNDFHWLSNEI